MEVHKMKKLISLVIVAMFLLSGFAALAENGTLTLATNVNFPPYEFYDDETGEPTGIDIEVAEGNKYYIRDIRWVARPSITSRCLP